MQNSKDRRVLYMGFFTLSIVLIVIIATSLFVFRKQIDPPNMATRYLLIIDGAARTVDAARFEQNVDDFVKDMPEAKILMKHPNEDFVRFYKLDRLSDAYDAGFSILHTTETISTNNK